MRESMLFLVASTLNASLGERRLRDKTACAHRGHGASLSLSLSLRGGREGRKATGRRESVSIAKTKKIEERTLVRGYYSNLSFLPKIK